MIVEFTGSSDSTFFGMKYFQIILIKMPHGYTLEQFKAIIAFEK